MDDWSNSDRRSWRDALKLDCSVQVLKPVSEFVSKATAALGGPRFCLRAVEVAACSGVSRGSSKGPADSGASVSWSA